MYLIVSLCMETRKAKLVRIWKSQGVMENLNIAAVTNLTVLQIHQTTLKQQARSNFKADFQAHSRAHLFPEMRFSCLWLDPCSPRAQWCRCWCRKQTTDLSCMRSELIPGDGRDLELGKTHSEHLCSLAVATLSTDELHGIARSRRIKAFVLFLWVFFLQLNCFQHPCCLSVTMKDHLPFLSIGVTAASKARVKLQ